MCALRRRTSRWEALATAMPWSTMPSARSRSSRPASSSALMCAPRRPPSQSSAPPAPRGARTACAALAAAARGLCQGLGRLQTVRGPARRSPWPSRRRTSLAGPEARPRSRCWGRRPPRGRRCRGLAPARPPPLAGPARLALLPAPAPGRRVRASWRPRPARQPLASGCPSTPLAPCGSRARGAGLPARPTAATPVARAPPAAPPGWAPGAAPTDASGMHKRGLPEAEMLPSEADLLRTFLAPQTLDCAPIEGTGASTPSREPACADRALPESQEKAAAPASKFGLGHLPVNTDGKPCSVLPKPRLPRAAPLPGGPGWAKAAVTASPDPIVDALRKVATPGAGNAARLPGQLSWKQPTKSTTGAGQQRQADLNCAPSLAKVFGRPQARGAPEFLPGDEDIILCTRALPRGPGRSAQGAAAGGAKSHLKRKRKHDSDSSFSPGKERRMAKAKVPRVRGGQPRSLDGAAGPPPGAPGEAALPRKRLRLTCTQK